MPIKIVTLLPFLWLTLLGSVTAQVFWEKDIAMVHKKINDQLYYNKADRNLATDGIFLVTIRIKPDRKVDSVFFACVVGKCTEVSWLGGLDLAEWRYAEKGVRYIIIPLIVINPKNDEGEDETVLDIYKQSFRNFLGKRQGIIRYTKPLVFINSKPMR
jgi:hypothetical protein